MNTHTRSFTVRERLLYQSAANPTTGCWDWLGSKTQTGYSTTWVDGVATSAHRAAYEAFQGPIPDGHELDHLCRNRGCINPHHLEPVSHKENLLRGTSPTARNARKTHCKNGHEFNAANTYHKPGTAHRQCRACAEASAARYRARKKVQS